jgi:hypothetical protein
MAYYLLASSGGAETEVTPEYNYKDSGKKMESRHRSRDGSEFIYKWGDYDLFDMEVQFVNQTFKTLVNDWWTNNDTLLWTDLDASDVSYAAYTEKTVTVSAEDTLPREVFFSSDGTKMFIAGDTNNTVFQYTLTTAWDVSTASYASKSKDVSAEEAAVYSIAFSADGTTMFAVGNTNASVYQYTLSTAWDVSTASYASKSKDVSAEGLSPSGLFFNSDGTIMRVQNLTNDAVYQYTLSTAWDVSTASYASKSISVASEESIPWGLTFNDDNTKMYVVGVSSGKVHQYYLSSIGINNVKIINKSKPVDRVMKPYDDLFGGKIKLSTY